jgi:hypothetical protein
MPLILKVRTIPGGRPAHGPARPYVWRDPARCSPERLEELAAHDDYIKALEAFWGARTGLERMRRHGLL